MSSFMVIALLICSSAALPATHDPDGERDGETSRKIIGSSVVTSVSVVLNGNDPQYTDAVGKHVERPTNQVGSPINLLNPDRYEFYTFNDKGDLVKRLMTMSEIQSIVASGDTDGQMLLQSLAANNQANTNVQEIVSSVQNVLNKEIASQKNNSAANQVLDTPDVTSTWSMILPAIFGNPGSEDIALDGNTVQIHSTNKISLDKLNTAELKPNATEKFTTTTETSYHVQAETIATSVPSISPALWHNHQSDNEYVHLPESEMVNADHLKTRPTKIPIIIDDESATPILLYIDNDDVSSTTVEPTTTSTTTRRTTTRRSTTPRSTTTRRSTTPRSTTTRRPTTPRSTTIRQTNAPRSTTTRATTTRRTTTPRSTTERRTTTPRTSTTRRSTISRTRRTTTSAPATVAISSTTENRIVSDELLETSSIANIAAENTASSITSTETSTAKTTEESTTTKRRTTATARPRRTTTVRISPSRRTTTPRSTTASTTTPQPTTAEVATQSTTSALLLLSTSAVNQSSNEAEEEIIESLKAEPVYNRENLKKTTVTLLSTPSPTQTTTNSGTFAPATTPTTTTTTTMTPTTTSTKSTTLPTTSVDTTTIMSTSTTNAPTNNSKRRPITTTIPDSFVSATNVNDDIANDFDRHKIEPLIHQISQVLSNEEIQSDTTVSPVMLSDNTQSMPTKTVASVDDLNTITTSNQKPDSTSSTAQSEAEFNKETEITTEMPVIQFTSPTLSAATTLQDEEKVPQDTDNFKFAQTDQYDLIETTTTPHQMTTGNEQQNTASFDTDSSFNQIIESLQQENGDFTENSLIGDQETTTTTTTSLTEQLSTTVINELKSVITTESPVPITTVTINEQNDDLGFVTTNASPVLSKEQERVEQSTTVINSESTENDDLDGTTTTINPLPVIDDVIDNLSDTSNQQEAVAHVFKNNLLIVDEEEPQVFEIPTTTTEPPTTTDITFDEEVIKTQDTMLPLLTRTHPVVQQIEDMVSEFSSEKSTETAQIADISLESIRIPSRNNVTSMEEYIEQAATVASILSDNTNDIVDENFSIEQMQDSLSDVLSQVADSTYKPEVKMTTIRAKSDDTPTTVMPGDNFHKFESLSHVTEASVENKDDDSNEIKFVTSIVKQTSSISTHTENPNLVANNVKPEHNKTVSGDNNSAMSMEVSQLMLNNNQNISKSTTVMKEQVKVSSEMQSTTKPIETIAEDILGLIGSIDENSFPTGVRISNFDEESSDQEESDDYVSNEMTTEEPSTTTYEYFTTPTDDTPSVDTTTVKYDDLPATTLNYDILLSKTDNYSVDLDEIPASSSNIRTTSYPDSEITTTEQITTEQEMQDSPQTTTSLPESKTDQKVIIEDATTTETPTPPSNESTEKYFTTTSKDAVIFTTTLQPNEMLDYSDEVTPMLLDTTEYYFEGPKIKQSSLVKDQLSQEAQLKPITEKVTKLTTTAPLIVTSFTTAVPTTVHVNVETTLKPSAPKIDDPLTSDKSIELKYNKNDKVISHINTQRPSMASIKIPALNPLKIERLPTTTKRKPVQVNLESPAPEMLGLEESTKTLSEDIKQFADLCNELAFSFWKSLTKEGISSARSLVVSPFAMTSMLSMVFLGARGATSGEMNEILQLDDMVTFNPHLILRNITDSVENPVEAGLANSVFVRELYTDRNRGKVISFYKEKAQQLYSGHVEEVSYNIINDIIRRRTNLLVKRHTWGKMPEYLKTNSIWLNGPLSAMSVNIYETDCSSASTADKDGEMFFQVLPTIRQRRLVPIPAAVYKSGFTAGYDPTLDATTVAFGAQNNIVSTIFIMPGQQGSAAPGDSLERLEQALIEKALPENAWSNLLKTLIDRPGLEVQIPRFSHRSFINATSALQKMGLKDVFDADKADLRGVTGSSNRDMYLSDMVQMNTFSTCGDDKINEHHHVEIYPAPQLRQKMLEETLTRPLIPVDADIADAYFYDPLFDTKYLELPLPLRPRQARLPDTPRLRFDRPFLYFARHNPTGVILYMGRFNPRLLP